MAFAGLSKHFYKLSPSISSCYKRSTLKPAVVACTQVRHADVKPDGYEFIFMPKEDLPASCPPEITPEQRAKLAAKYNLRPEDYVPMNDFDFNVGDYPKLPDEGCRDRDPHYDWDDPFWRRNFGEPIHFEIERFLPSEFDTIPEMHDRTQQRNMLLSVVVFMVVMSLIGERFKFFKPIAPKQFPEVFPKDDNKSIYVDAYRNEGKVKEKRHVHNYTF